MAPLTYHNRVQNVLGNIARSHQRSVELEVLVVRVRDSVLNDLLPVSSRFQAMVDAAIHREKQAGRLKIVRERDRPARIELTDRGARYFKGVGVVSLYRAGEAQFERLTTAQLHQQSAILRDILFTTCEILRRHPVRPINVTAFEEVPTICADLAAQIKTLGEQNTELSEAHSHNRAAMRALGISLY